jgi:hypothetical protein
VYGMQGVGALIGLAVPGRPIGPWSRRTGAPQASATGRDPKGAAAPRSRLANDAVVAEDEPRPAIKLGANGTSVYQRNLTGRATSVPFTRVNVGYQRTTTDNTTAAATCAARLLRK